MKLYYFDFAARGEPIRLLLTHAGVKFEDVRIKLQDWMSYKPTFEMHQVPVLEIEPGHRLNQSYAILEYLGLKYGYLPKGYDALYRCLCVMNTAEDLLIKGIGFLAPSPLSLLDEKTKEAGIPNFIKNEATLSFKLMEKMLKENKTQDFIIGGKHTIADFCLVGMYVHILTFPGFKECFEKKIHDEFPVLYTYLNKRLAEFNLYYKKCDLKLYYFTTPGRAEMTRILFRHLNISFTDIRFTQDQWAGEKKSGKFELEQLPTLICEPCGCKMSQSDAIIQTLGTKYGLMPKQNKPEKVYEVVCICHICKDMIDDLVRIEFTPGIAPDKKKQSKAEYYEKRAPVFLSALENKLKLNKSQLYFVEKSFTIADFAFVGMLRGLVFSPTFPEYKAIFEKYPLLVKFHEYHKGL